MEKQCEYKKEKNYILGVIYSDNYRCYECTANNYKELKERVIKLSSKKSSIKEIKEFFNEIKVVIRIERKDFNYKKGEKQIITKIIFDKKTIYFQKLAKDIIFELFGI